MVPSTPASAGRPQGLASVAVDVLLDRVLMSWTSFADLAETVDLAAPTRLRGWTAREVVLHLGSWDAQTPLAGAMESARTGVLGATPDADGSNAALVDAHRDATDDEVRAALRRSCAAIAELDRAELARLATAPASSILGPLPLAGLVHAGCYELAVHALDLHAAGAAAPDPALLDAGLAALIDVTGGLAARHDIEVSVAAQPPDGGWRTRVDEGGWRTEPTPPGKVDGPAILGTAADILDASAGRAAVPALILQRRIVVQDLGDFLRLAPLVEQVPGIPGAALLRRAASTITGVRGALKRLPGLPGLRR